MESRPSVMAKLMGLDELPQPKESLQKPHQVISETYRQRVARIGIGKKQLYCGPRSVSKSLDQDKEFCRGNRHNPDANLELSLCMKPQNSLELHGQSKLVGSRSDCFHGCNPKGSNLARSGNMTASKSPRTVVSKNVDVFGKSRRRRSEFGGLEPAQKVVKDNVLGRIHHDAASSQTVMQCKALQSLNEKRSCSLNSHLGGKKCTGFLNPLDRGVGVEQKERNNFCCDVESTRQSPASREILEELSRRTRRRISTTGSSSGSRVSDTCFKPEFATLPSLEKVLVTEDQNQLAGKFSPTKNVGPAFAVSSFDVSRLRNHKLSDGRCGLKNIELRRLSKVQAKYEAFRSKWHLKSEKPLNWARISLRKHNFELNTDGSEPQNMKVRLETAKSVDSEDFHTNDDKSLRGLRARKDAMKSNLDSCSMYEQNMMLPNSLMGSVDSASSVADVVMGAETDLPAGPSENSENEHLESNILFEEDDDCSSHATDGSVRQEASIGSDGGSSAFSSCSNMELDSLVTLEDGYQQSPISVLELPFSREAMVYGTEFLGRVKDDIYGQELEYLKPETLETYSEGSGMAASSDEESKEGLARDPTKENEAYMKICAVEESRNFLYLIEVITKASLHGKNLADFSTWDSLECPIGLSHFEALEKNYCNRISWKRSERRHLFDRINAGLLKILSPRIGVPTWEHSVSRRFSATKGAEMIKEDLWKLLVSQDKECSAEEKVIGSEFGKLELGDEIDGIGQEIERLLFDELVAEFFY